MDKVLAWAKNGFALVGVLFLGFWLGSGRAVHAYSDDSGNGVQFQLAGSDLKDSLLVYQPSKKTIYVYRGASQGNDAMQCSYMFQMDRPGDVIHRQPCGMQYLDR